MRLFSLRSGADGWGGRGRRHRHRHRQKAYSTLADVANGETFRVTRLAATGEIRQRLIDMGFIRGATGRVLRAALLGDPIELQMPGYKVSLRRSEARDIFVEEVA